MHENINYLNLLLNSDSVTGILWYYLLWNSNSRKGITRYYI